MMMSLVSTISYLIIERYEILLPHLRTSPVTATCEPSDWQPAGVADFGEYFNRSTRETVHRECDGFGTEYYYEF